MHPAGCTGALPETDRSARAIAAANAMSNIYVSSLFTMPHHVQRLGIEHLVSIIQPEFQPATPAGIVAGHHHRVAVHDIDQACPPQVLATAQHVADLLEFLASRPPASSLLVHCYAGVSRSTAVALIAHVMRGGAPESSARLLRAQAPHARPNNHIIRLADEALGLDNRLVEAVATMGPARVEVFDAGPLTTLPPAGASGQPRKS